MKPKQKRRQRKRLPPLRRKQGRRRAWQRKRLQGDSAYQPKPPAASNRAPLHSEPETTCNGVRVHGVKGCVRCKSFRWCCVLCRSLFVRCERVVHVVVRCRRPHRGNVSRVWAEFELVSRRRARVRSGLHRFDLDEIHAIERHGFLLLTADRRYS